MVLGLPEGKRSILVLSFEGMADFREYEARVEVQ